MHLLSNRHALATLEALDRSLAVVEFTPDARLITANANFLTLMGYELAEIAGKPHTLFVRPDERASEAYAAFWDDLRRGALNRLNSTA